MSESQIKVVFVRLPLNLARSIKVDAAMAGQTIQDWIREAAESRLKDRESEAIPAD